MGQKRQTPDLESALAGQSQGTGAYEGATFDDRLARYTKARKRSRAVAGYILSNPDKWSGDADQLHKRAAQIRSCGLWMLFRHYTRIDQRRLAAVHTCRQHWLCEFCAIRRAARSMSVYLKRLDEIRKTSPHLRPYLLTLTVKNGHDLTERFDHLRVALDKLRKGFNNKKQGMSDGGIYGLFSGGVCSVEVTYSNQFGWHPHVHILALGPADIWEVNQFLQAQNKKDTWLSQEWLDITGDSFIVDVRPIEGDTDSDIAKGAAEVFKYALKMSDLDIDKQVSAFLHLAGRRMLFSFGCFWGVKVPDDVCDELLENETEYVDLLYGWFVCGYQQIRKITKEEIEKEKAQSEEWALAVKQFYKERRLAISSPSSVLLSDDLPKSC